MKKVAVWLSDEERDALAQYCQKQGKSMYSVLKEAVGGIIQGESPIASKQGGDLFAPSVQTTEVVSPKLYERFNRIEREIDKITGNEQLWHEVSELKAAMGEIKGLVSGLVQRVTNVEESLNKFDKKIVDTVVAAVQESGLLEETE